ncbi:hypothetical protein [Xylanimonas protaetiae]|uniref:Uncharacterized protein n=1 Tax=Xylanimonas protaetiae TaxID=2509457 RepID=A0A4P6F6S9_9MICO|nr:hypothetical protein [Xylanimonas protaetiae]QAY70039.1 hypothetical protein ET471_08320 [Xylanimonas protaetiae]
MTIAANFAPPNRTEQTLRSGPDERAAYTAEVGATRVRADLHALLGKLKDQRTIKANQRVAGDLAVQDHARWLAGQKAYEMHVKAWLADLDEAHPVVVRDVDEQHARRRAALTHHIHTIDTLALAIHTYLEDEDASEDILEDALDATLWMGADRPAVPLRDAIAQGLLPHTPGR